MFRGKVVAVAILIVDLGFVGALVCVQVAERSVREAMYRRYFQEHLKP